MLCALNNVCVGFQIYHSPRLLALLRGLDSVLLSAGTTTVYVTLTVEPSSSTSLAHT
jgi:hypothetical protein